MTQTLLNGIGNEQMLSILKDPFKKACVTEVWVAARDLSDRPKFLGWVEFKNGNTTGKQDFKGESFDDVVRQIKLFIQDLGNKA